MKKIILLFLALFTAVFFFEDNNSSKALDEKESAITLAAGTEGEIDYSKPRINSEKAYVSNIPDSWYDESINCGILPSGSGGGKSYVDLISLDGQINYNSPEYYLESSSILIELVVGEEFGFYVEAGYTDFYRTIYDDYNINFATGYYDFEIINSYYDLETSTLNSQTIFSTTDSPDTSSFLKDYSVGYGIEAVDIDSDARIATRNEAYRMDKFLFTATQTGISKFSLMTTDTSNGYNTFIDIIFHVSDNEDNQIGFGDFLAVNDNSEYRYIGSVANDTSGDAVINQEFCDYSPRISFAISTLYYDSGNQGFNYEMYFSNITPGLSLDTEYSPYYFSADKPGKYSFDVTILYTLKYIDYSSAYNSYVFVKTFKINLNLIEDITVDCGADLGNNTIQLVQNEEYDLRSNSYPVEKFDISYTLNNQLHETSKILFAETGTYTISLELYDIYNNITYSTDYTVIVVEDKEYYQAPKFNTGSNPTVDVDTLSSEGYTVTISNYEYISKNATIKVEALSDTINYEFIDDKITLISGSVGANKLNVIAIYNDKVVSSILTINVVSKYEFALDKTVVEMDANSEAKIRIGYVNDGIFTSLNENEDYYIMVSLSDNEITATLNASNEIVIISGLSSKQVTGSVVIIINDIMIEAFNFTVIVGEEDADIIDTEIDIVEGSTFRLLLGDKTPTINVNLDPIVSNRDYDFNWISLNSKVATVMKTDELSASITGVGVGTTEIIAICQTPDGSTITARATIIVLNTIPEIYLNIDSVANAESALTIYDLLNVSINNNGFNFSSQISIEWYVDDEIIATALDKNQATIALNNKQNSFYYKLSEGLHNVKAVITDNYYGFTVTASKDVNISPLEYQDRQLSFAESEISLILNGSNYKLDVLLDGAISSEYTYLWSVDDNKIVSVEMSSGASAIIKPMSAGETYINAFTNIGKYQDRIIRTQIKIIVEEISSVELKLENEFNKPGDDVKISVLVNGKTGFKNFEPNIVVKLDGQEIDYEYEDSVIALSNAKSGKFSVNLRYDMVEANTSFKVTNFNIKEFILTILPYLIIALIITVAIFVLFKVNNNAFKKVKKAINNLDKEANSILLDEKELDEKTVKRIYSKLLKKAKSLNRSLQYFYDEGIDEFNHTIKNTEALVKILVALIRSPKSNVNKIRLVINNLRNNQIKTIIDNVNEIINSRVKYQENIKKIMSEGEIDPKNKKKKKKIKAEDYHQYLIEKGILVYDDEIPDNDDN
ncbi:MAG: hypothetical protein IJY14_02705 [Acholeplasmatales bacterium]|nr:hypothetical protein [Acholeplasmatales bacterium]